MSINEMRKNIDKFNYINLIIEQNEKNLPDYLKSTDQYIDDNGNLIGSDTYKVNDYEKYDYISEKTHSFLVNWTWNSYNLHFHQTHGLQSIDDDIINELSQWKPSTPVKLYRVICDNSENEKYKTNKLKSYFKTLEEAKSILSDMGCEKTGGFIDSKIFTPDQILVDITMIPNYSDLDLIDEVIVIS